MTTLEQIGLGNEANDGNGDPLRSGGEKINANFTKLNNLRRIVCDGELQIYKGAGNTSIDNIEPGDAASGFLNSDIFLIFGIYKSGDQKDLTAYDQNSANYIDLDDSEDSENTDT